MDLKILFQENWEMIIGLIILFFFLFFITILVWEEKRDKKKFDKSFLICPIRGALRVKKYDAVGNYSEEYQRIRLIKYFLAKGYSKSSLKCEYPIERSFGCQGRSRVKIQVDLIIKRGEKFLVVVEVKKNYHPKKKKSAIEHQLKPAMEWTNSKYGIYWDGSKHSCLLTKNTNGKISVRQFP